VGRIGHTAIFFKANPESGKNRIALPDNSQTVSGI